MGQSAKCQFQVSGPVHDINMYTSPNVPAIPSLIFENDDNQPRKPEGSNLFELSLSPVVLLDRIKKYFEWHREQHRSINESNWKS
jgi:hypothetical protein